jgi:superfamily II DNA or RNA helicase
VVDPSPERRRFNSSERVALYLAADGKCTECRTDLEPGWHGDHIHPHVAGGSTDVINGQALCPRCNLKKGSSLNAPRKWQADALREFMLWQPEGDHGFLVEATPGAGKTKLSIEIAVRLLDAGRIDRIVIAVPTARLETQWAEEFGNRGININPNWHAGDGTLAPDVKGCVATYAEIARQSQIYRGLVAKVPTLVILDEIHHCGEEHSWGVGARKAFQPAARKLLLSGTPFRSTNDAIPFVRYVDGIGAPDFRYGYDKALGDRVVRAVFFPRRGGQMEWEWNGEKATATFDDRLANQDAGRRLRTALSPSGQWIPQVVADADKMLMDLRERDPHAGGIVFCETSSDARAVEAMLARLGRNPVLVISEEPEADTRIGEFKKSKAPWIVSIRKVSEGVDIPRLRVGVYATPWLTEMFFRQVVGRLVRTNSAEEDPTAYLFIPDDQRLREMAQQIRAQREHILDQQEDEQLSLFGGSLGGGDGDGDLGVTRFRPVSATATDQGIIVDTATVTPEELAFAEQVKMQSPETAILATAAVAQLLKNAGKLGTVPIESKTGEEPHHHERVENLRKDNNTIVARINRKHGVEYNRVAAALNVAVGLPAKGGVKIASEDQLVHRLKIGHDWLSSGTAPGGAL